MTKSQQKVSSIEKLSNQEGIISALAFDQRGALKRMMAEHQSETPTVEQIEQLKVLFRRINSICVFNFIGSRIWFTSIGCSK